MKDHRSRILAGVAAAAIAIALAIVGGYLAGRSTTTVVSPQVLTAPPDASAVIEAQKAACPDTTRVEPAGAPEPPASPDCTATLAPEQLKGAAIPPPSIVHAGPGDPPNGQYPASALSPATGCSRGLAKDAAAAWNHVAVVVHDHTGYWLQSNGDASCYRTFQQQVELRTSWCNQGNCANAAVPGTSNHGWGLAVDAPPATVSAIHTYAGGLFGQGYGSCSDAPWEGWHVKYCGGFSGPDPGPYGQAAVRAIRRGSKGKNVLVLTSRLARLAAPGKRDHFIRWANRGHTCRKPCAAGIRGFQRAEHLDADGVAGPATLARVDARWRFYRHRRGGH